MEPKDAEAWNLNMFQHSEINMYFITQTLKLNCTSSQLYNTVNIILVNSYIQMSIK